LAFANNTMIWAVHTDSLLKGNHGPPFGGREIKRGHVNITGSSQASVTGTSFVIFWTMTLVSFLVF